MRMFRLSAVFICAFLLAAALGCNRDPNVRKQKYFESGNRYFEKGEFPEAVIEFANAVQIDPQYPRFYVQLATLQTADLKSDAAEISLKKALELDPKFVPAVHALALLYENEKQWADAEKEMRYAITLEPKRSEPRNWLAQLYY